jgi:hypothetical protein
MGKIGVKPRLRTATAGTRLRAATVGKPALASLERPFW